MIQSSHRFGFLLRGQSYLIQFGSAGKTGLAGPPASLELALSFHQPNWIQTTLPTPRRPNQTWLAWLNHDFWSGIEGIEFIIKVFSVCLSSANDCANYLAAPIAFSCIVFLNLLQNECCLRNISGVYGKIGNNGFTRNSLQTLLSS